MSMFNKQQNQNDDYHKSMYFSYTWYIWAVLVKFGFFTLGFMNVFSQLIQENKENDKQIRVSLYIFQTFKLFG